MQDMDKEQFKIDMRDHQKYQEKTRNYKLQIKNNKNIQVCKLVIESVIEIIQSQQEIPIVKLYSIRMIKDCSEYGVEEFNQILQEDLLDIMTNILLKKKPSDEWEVLGKMFISDNPTQEELKVGKSCIFMIMEIIYMWALWFQKNKDRQPSKFYKKFMQLKQAGIELPNPCKYYKEADKYKFQNLKNQVVNLPEIENKIQEYQKFIQSLRDTLKDTDQNAEFVTIVHEQLGAFDQFFNQHYPSKQLQGVYYLYLNQCKKSLFAIQLFQTGKQTLEDLIDHISSIISDDQAIILPNQDNQQQQQQQQILQQTTQNNDTIKQMEQNIQHLKSENQKQQNVVNDLTKAKDVLQEENVKLKQELDKVQGFNNKDKQKNVQETVQLQQERDRLSVRVAELEKGQQDIKTLNIEIKGLQKENSDLKISINEAQFQKDELNKANTDLKKKLQNMQQGPDISQRLQQLENNNKEYEHKYRQLQDKYEMNLIELQNSIKQVESQKILINQYQNKIQQNTQEIQKLEKIKDQLNERILQLQTQISKVGKQDQQNSSPNQSQVATQKQQQDLQAQLEQLQQQLQEMHKKASQNEYQVERIVNNKRENSPRIFGKQQIQPNNYSEVNNFIQQSQIAMSKTDGFQQKKLMRLSELVQKQQEMKQINLFKPQASYPLEDQPLPLINFDEAISEGEFEEDEEFKTDQKIQYQSPINTVAKQMMYPHNNPIDYYQNKSYASKIKGRIVENNPIKLYPNLPQKDKELSKFKRSCLKSTMSIYNNKVLQIGMYQELIYQNNKNYLKSNLYYINLSPNMITNLSVSISKSFSYQQWIRPDVIHLNLAVQGRVGQEIIQNLEVIPYQQMVLQISYVNQKKIHVIDVCLPNSINKFFVGEQTSQEKFDQAWKSSNLNIMKSEQLDIDTRVIEGIEELRNKIYPNLINLNFQDKRNIIQNENQQFNEIIKYGGIFQQQQTGTRILIKFLALPNKKLVIQGTYVNSLLDQLHYQATEVFIQTLMLLLGKKK